MSIVDANVILRYLLDDHPELSPRSAEILELDTVILPIEVACEVIYVLQKVYNVERHEIQQKMANLLAENLIRMDKYAVFLEALKFYSLTKLDFVDCLLLSYHVIEKHEVISFDQKLVAFIRHQS